MPDIVVPPPLRSRLTPLPGVPAVRRTTGASLRQTPARLPRVVLGTAVDPRRIVRWVYLGRFIVAAAIFLAAQVVWEAAPADHTRIASLVFALTVLFTGASAFYTEVVRPERLTRVFCYLQTLFDVVMVTAIVHVTGGSVSHFAALYILVIASAALLLPVGGGLSIALLADLCYFAEVLFWSHTVPDVGVWLQLGVFGSVALGCGFIGARLQEAGVGTAAELVRTRLHSDDILRNIRSGILTVDQRGYLIYANPAAEELLGLGDRASLAGPILARIAASAPELARALERAATRRERMTRGEDTVTRAGKVFPIGITTTFSEVEGPTGITTTTATAIFQDISGQKRLERLHVRAGRLEAVAELGASLAHEIKNPLASIRSAVEQLSRMPQADDDGKSLGALIVRESDRLSRLLTEFLDFARVRVARLQPLDVTTIARGAILLVESHPDRGAGVTIRCSVPPEPLVIDGDEDLLHRALFNLLLNAVQATPAGGDVRLEMLELPGDQLPAGVTMDAGAVVIRISDTGPGIASEILDQLFEPFMTTKPGGSGLGLPVVHRSIEAHRGVVLVDSSADGTRFTVLLPHRQSRDSGVSE
jgi:two-component system sensor histidine kinase PilS (NtrC family)